MSHADAPADAENEYRPIELNFTIPGPPVPAVRMTQRSKYVDPAAQNYLAWKAGVGYIARAAGATCWDGPVMVSVNIYGVDRLKRTFDVDNVLKGILDGLRGVCYRDDKQVTSASVRVYSRGEECVKVWVSPCT